MASTDQKAKRAKDSRAILDAVKTAAGKGFAPYKSAQVGDEVEFVNVGEPFKGLRGVVSRLGNDAGSGQAIHVRLNDIPTEDGKGTRKNMIQGHVHFAARDSMLRLIKAAPKKANPAKETVAA